MLQIDNHNELALAAVISYLLQFPEIYKLTENNANRYQLIENIAWQLLHNLDYNTASGIWLDYIGKKVGQTRIYTPKAVNAFTFGGTRKEGFGAGKFKSAASLRSTKLTRTDSTFRNAIKAKIIQNNTNATLQDVILGCKLLFNATYVKLVENYPASVSFVHIYGSELIKTIDAIPIMKTFLPAGVSIGQMVYHSFYNLFKNNAFIEYSPLIPETDDFELSFTIIPDTLTGKEIGLFSQGYSYTTKHQPVQMFYDEDDGVTFYLQPDKYVDSYVNPNYYNDEESFIYEDSDFELKLSSGTDALSENESVNIKVTREGNVFSLYLDGALKDQVDAGFQYKITQDNVKTYLGVANGVYYNSGSMYNLYLRNATKDEVLINDTLKKNTIGKNNGVKFL